MNAGGSAVDVVRRWHEALNCGDLERLAAVMADDVGFVGPRGAGRGAGLVRDWAERSGIRLVPERWFARDGTVVVGERAAWRSPETGDLSPPSEVASVFHVRDGLVRRVARYDTIAEALGAAGLDESTEVDPDAPSGTDAANAGSGSRLVIAREHLPYVGNSHELEGHLHADTPLSIIFFDGPPGSGPKLHRHPYAEVFIVLEGSATFTVGEATIDVSGGQIAIAPANTPHKFVNSGDGPLRQIDIHANERFITDWLEE